MSRSLAIRTRGLFVLALIVACLSVASSTDITLNPAGSLSAHGMTLSWTQSVDSVSFHAYKVYRSTSAGVDTNKTLVSTITNRATLSAADNGLRTSTVYYYKVFVVDNAGVVLGTSAEISQTTLANAYPFTDDMEGTTTLNYSADAPWGVTTFNPHGGSHSWTDSPGGNYNDGEDASLVFHMDLSSAVMPVLQFYTRYATEVNVDYARVEIKTGGIWQVAGYFTGSQSTWKNVKIDLTPWTGSADVEIHFRFLADNNGVTSDGWSIDDISVAETPTTSLGYPFYESFDDTSSQSKWDFTQWDVQTGGRSSPGMIHDSPNGPYLQSGYPNSYSTNPYAATSFTTSGVIDLSHAVNPVLTFWQMYDMRYLHDGCYNESDYGRVYISTSYGSPGTWINLYNITGSGHTTDFERVELDLSAYVGSPNVRLMFQQTDSRDFNGGCGDNSGAGDGWWIDDIRVENRPAAVVMTSLTDVSMHGATLNWVANADTAFLQYQIYRSTSPTVNTSSTLLATITNQATTSYRDNSAILQPNYYYYRMYAVDTRSTLSPGSSTLQALYTVPTVTFPVFDDVNTPGDTVKWAWGFPWGRTTEKHHSGTSSWADSPGASYGPNANTSLSAFVNLSGSATPVLSFWQIHSFEQSADFGFVEVSTDGGGTWATIQTITGVDTAWTEQRVDLTPYTGGTIGLRFRVQSNASTQLDGWYIDDISIADGPRIASYPFTEDFESGFSRWYPQSPWGLSSTAHGGTHSMTDSPAGSYSDDEDASLLLHINLAAAQMPLLTFWNKYGTEPNGDYGRVEVSTGSGWVIAGYFTGSQTAWKKVKIDLTQWAGVSDVRIRFRFTGNSDGTNSDGWYIDDISIAEPATTTLSYPFYDSFDDTTSALKWDFAQWEIMSNGNSAPGRVHDSPVGPYLQSGYYGSYSNDPHQLAGMVSSGVIDLSHAVHPTLTFNQQYDLRYLHDGCYNESDIGRVYISTNYGLPGTWINVYNVTGSGHTSDWERAEIDLTPYIGNTAVRLMFVVDESRDLNGGCNDNSGAGDGWWLDDIRLENGPQVLVQSPAANVSLHGATISWSGNTDSTLFQKYEIYQNTNTTVDLSSTLVATITNASTHSFRDVYTLVQPTKYSYRVYEMDVHGVRSPGSNVVTANYTVPTSNFPFADSVEVAADTAKWNWSTPWGRTNEKSHSGGFSWTDSPHASYGPNANSALTINVNLSGSAAPVLTFWNTYGFEQGVDFGYVEASTDGGNTWITLRSTTGVDTAWTKVRVDLSDYSGSTIGLRFRVVSNGATHLDGWYIDDIVIDNGPRIVGYPFTEDFESGFTRWFPQNPWGLTSTAHGGGNGMTDSPAGNYADNEDASLLLHIDLSHAQMPLLKFWQRYGTEVNGDYCRVEVNTGTGWEVPAYWTGSQSTWKQEKVDLTKFAGSSDVMIRFRLLGNSDGTASDGWYIDDISIAEGPTTNLGYPFFETWDDTASFSRWDFAQWEVVTGGRSGTGRVHDSPSGPYLQSGEYNSYSNNPLAFSTLTTAGVIDLSHAVSPVMTFWQKFDMRAFNDGCYYEFDYGQVYISTNYGLPGTWTNIYSVTGLGHTGTWERVQLDLSPYVGSPNVRIMFSQSDSRDLRPGCNDNSGAADGWWIDDIRVDENLASLNVVDIATLESPTEIFTIPGQPTPRIYGLVYKAGVTDAGGQGSGIIAQVGYGADSTLPNDTTWSWSSATYLNDNGIYDRYFGSVTAGTLGSYNYTMRFSRDGGVHWIYADLDGNYSGSNEANGYTPDQSGLLVVSARPQMYVHADSISVFVPENELLNWTFTIENSGSLAQGPLGLNLVESTDGVNPTELTWVAVNPSRTSVAVNGSKTFTVTFDATGLTSGTRDSAVILINSNDPDQPHVVVPIILHVVPGGSVILSGLITDNSGGQLSTFASIQVLKNGTLITSVTSDVHGNYSIYGLTPDFYTLHVTASGFFSKDLEGVQAPRAGYNIKMNKIPAYTISRTSVNVYGNASTYKGNPLQPGDVITAVDPNGVVCGSFTVKNAGKYGFMHVQGDDPSTGVDEGALAGDTLTFYINEFPAKVHGPSSPVWTTDNAVLNIELSAEDVDSVRLRANWNLMSFTVTPAVDSIAAILSPLTGNYRQVSTFDLLQGGARTYDPTLPQFSDLFTMDPTHGYWIKMTSAATLGIRGGRYHADEPLSLLQGWNLTSYLLEQSLLVSKALQSISPKYDIVSGFDNGAQTYVPGSPFNDLVKMSNGFGYFIKMHAAGSLNYAAAFATTSIPAGIPSATLAMPPRLIHTSNGVVPTPLWNDYFGRLTSNGVPAPVGEVVEAFNPRGVKCGEYVVQTAGLYGFLHVYGDDPTTDADEGGRTGDVISFYHKGKLIGQTNSEALAWNGDRTTREYNLDLVLGIADAQLKPGSFELMQNYPNPFNPTTIIHYQVPALSHVSLKIYDVLGEEVRTLVEGDQPAGFYDRTWDGTANNGLPVSGGLYFYRLSAGQFTQTLKMVYSK